MRCGIVAEVAYLFVPSVATCIVVGLVSLFGSREISSNFVLRLVGGGVR
jgi:hypothetical protein